MKKMIGVRPLPTGNVIDFNDVVNYRFTVEEVAKLLSYVKRFNGVGISVASHSVLVAHILYQKTGSASIALLGLFHDAAEAYIGDVSTPVKFMLGAAWNNLESRVQREILWQLNIVNEGNIATKPLVKEADMSALKWELDHLNAWHDYHIDALGVWSDYLADVEGIPSTLDIVNLREDPETLFIQTYDYFISLQGSVKGDSDKVSKFLKP